MTNEVKVKSQTTAFLEKTYGKQITDQEAIEYKERLVKFFALLMEIDQKNKRKEGKNEN